MLGSLSATKKLWPLGHKANASSLKANFSSFRPYCDYQLHESNALVAIYHSIFMGLLLFFICPWYSLG
jgi:hypothetical protein